MVSIHPLLSPLHLRAGRSLTDVEVKSILPAFAFYRTESKIR